MSYYTLGISFQFGQLLTTELLFKYFVRFELGQTVNIPGMSTQKKSPKKSSKDTTLSDSEPFPMVTTKEKEFH